MLANVRQLVRVPEDASLWYGLAAGVSECHLESASTSWKCLEMPRHKVLRCVWKYKYPEDVWKCQEMQKNNENV